MASFLGDPRVMELVTGILMSLLQLLFLAVGGFAVRYLKANTSQKSLDLAKDIAQVAVEAAEQLAAAGKIDYTKKFETAIVLARDQANKWGLNFTDSQWEGFIEAAVKSMKELGEELWPQEVLAERE